MRRPFLLLSVLFAVLGSLGGVQSTSAYLTDTAPHAAPNYDSFTPPPMGQSWNDPVFGTPIKRLSDAMHHTDNASGGMLTWVLNEYSTMSAFNNDNSRLILLHASYFALYDGSGNYVRDLPFEIHAGSEPRWSRTNGNVLYYLKGNQLKQYDVSNGAMSVVRTFSEYSSISGRGESDISFDGSRFVLVGNGRYIFVYTIPTDTKGPVLDTGGRAFDSVYLTPDNNVTVSWIQTGSARYNGVELFNGNMVFVRHLMRSGGHMDVTRDTTGAEVIVWTNSNDAYPIPCENGVVKVRLSDAQQTCLRELDWSLGVHISCPDSGGWCFVSVYAPGEPSPSNWPAFTNELLQVKLDGTETRRLAHHRSRALNDYNYMPKAMVSRDGTRVVFGSNHDLQNILRYPTEYSDAFLVNVPSGGGGSSTVPAPTPTPTPTPTTGGGDTTGGSGTTTGTTIRVEENGAGVTRSSGHWYDNASTNHSGGNAILAMDTGAWVQLTFKGVGAKWIGYRDEWAGIARVYVDGVLKGTIDTAGTGQSKQVLYTVDNLADANHTLKIEVTGSIGPNSTQPWIWIDGFDVVSGAGGTTGGTGGTTPTVTTGWSRVQGNGATYTGTWYDNVHTWHSGGAAKLAMLAGDQVRFEFTGTGVRWIGYRDEWAGKAKVYVDGVLMKSVDTYSSTGLSQQVIYSVEGLAKGAHTLRVYVTGTKNRKSGGKWVWIDAFDVKP